MAPAAACEVNQMTAIRREIGAAFVDPPSQPLSELELIGIAIPTNRADGVHGAAPEHNSIPRFGRQENVEPSRKRHCALFASGNNAVGRWSQSI
jgi:hypothetical protein